MRGYPDFYGQPIFQKKSPLKEIRFDPSYDDEAIYHTLIEINDKGVFDSISISCSAMLSMQQFMIKIEVDDNIILSISPQIPPDPSNFSYYTQLFKVEQFNRLLNTLSILIDKEMSFSYLFRLSISQVFPTLADYATIGYYSLFI